MLFIAEGRINRPVDGIGRTQTAAWLGPMVDAGFLQSGYLDTTNGRVLLVLSAGEKSEVDQRIAHLPVVQDGTVTFSVSQVTALRFT